MHALARPERGGRAGVERGDAVVTGRVWQRGKADEMRKQAARAMRGAGRGGRGRGRAPARGARCAQHAQHCRSCLCGRQALWIDGASHMEHSLRLALSH
jgi:hypothetical protein